MVILGGNSYKLEDIRIYLKAAMIYKIANNLVNMPCSQSPYLPPSILIISSLTQELILMIINFPRQQTSPTLEHFNSMLLIIL